jgi:hypothetical protein
VRTRGGGADAAGRQTVQSSLAVAAVNGAAWCPANATVLRCVTDAGRLELWDIERSVLPPIAEAATKEGALLLRDSKPEERLEGSGGRGHLCILEHAPYMVGGRTEL